MKKQSIPRTYLTDGMVSYSEILLVSTDNNRYIFISSDHNIPRYLGIMKGYIKRAIMSFMGRSVGSFGLQWIIMSLTAFLISCGISLASFILSYGFHLSISQLFWSGNILARVWLVKLNSASQGINYMI